MNAFRYLAAAIAAALNGAYEDAGRIFAYAIKEADAKSLMQELAEFAVAQHIASDKLSSIEYAEAAKLLQNILGVQYSTEALHSAQVQPQMAQDQSQTEEVYIPTPYDPSKGMSESAGPGVGQETTQDIPQDRLYNTAPPVSRDQTFQSLDPAIQRRDKGEEQRRSKDLGSSDETKTDSTEEGSDAEASTEFADFPESSDDVKKQTGDAPFSIVDTAIQNEEDEKEHAMSNATPKHHSHRRQGSRLARSVSVSLSNVLGSKVNVLSTSEVSLSDAESEPNSMNHPENTDRSDWVDENDLVTSPNPTKIHKHDAESSDDTLETDSEDDMKEDGEQIDETISNKMPVIDVLSNSAATILDFGPDEKPTDGLKPVDDEDEDDDASEDDVPVPDDDIPGAPLIPASFSHDE